MLQGICVQKKLNFFFSLQLMRVEFTCNINLNMKFYLRKRGQEREKDGEEREKIREEVMVREEGKREGTRTKQRQRDGRTERLK